MANRTAGKKRPCRVCGRWFRADSRVGARQKTCGGACRREWHRRQCARWNKENQACFRQNYLGRKLQRLAARPAATEGQPSPAGKKEGAGPRSPPAAGERPVGAWFPAREVQETLSGTAGLRLAAILAYVFQIWSRRVQDEIMSQLKEKKAGITRLEPAAGPVVAAPERSSGDRAAIHWPNDGCGALGHQGAVRGEAADATAVALGQEGDRQIKTATPTA
jgi:hypothetical protein